MTGEEKSLTEKVRQSENSDELATTLQITGRKRKPEVEISLAVLADGRHTVEVMP